MALIKAVQEMLEQMAHHRIQVKVSSEEVVVAIGAALAVSLKDATGGNYFPAGTEIITGAPAISNQNGTNGGSGGSKTHSGNGQTASGGGGGIGGAGWGGGGGGGGGPAEGTDNNWQPDVASKR